MTYEGSLGLIGRWKAQVSLTAYQFRFVTLNATYNTIEPVNNVTDKPEGVLRNAPALGYYTEVVTDGITKLVTGVEGLAVDDYVRTDATGQGVKCVQADKILIRGKCLEAASEGELAVIELMEFTTSIPSSSSSSFSSSSSSSSCSSSCSSS